MSVSVIIPVNNQERTIGKAVESALTQRHPDIEVIVINDGSDDKTGEIIDRYAGLIKIINHNQRLGPYNSRFDGIASATKEWITFIDGDDYIKPSAIADCVSVAESTNADIVQMKIKRRISRWNCSINLPLQQYDISKALDAVIYDDKLFPVQYWGKLYKRSIVKPTVGNHIIYNGMWGDDRLFNLQIFSHSPKIAKCDSAEYVYRWGGFTSEPTDRLAEYVTVDYLKRKFLKENNLMNSRISRFMTEELIRFVCYNTRQSINSGQGKEYILNNLINCGIDFYDPVIGILPEEIYNKSKYSVSRFAKRLLRHLL